MIFSADTYYRTAEQLLIYSFLERIPERKT